MKRGTSACGVVQLIDIGLDLPEAAVTSLQSDDVAALLPRPEPQTQKYRRGVVGIRAGSRRYPGAGVLSTSGAAGGSCSIETINSGEIVIGRSLALR